MAKFDVVYKDMFRVDIARRVDESTYHMGDTFYVTTMEHAASVIANYPFPTDSVCVAPIKVADYQVRKEETDDVADGNDVGC